VSAYGRPERIMDRVTNRVIQAGRAPDARRWTWRKVAALADACGRVKLRADAQKVTRMIADLMERDLRAESERLLTYEVHRWLCHPYGDDCPDACAAEVSRVMRDLYRAVESDEEFVQVAPVIAAGLSPEVL
jgi:hypothetical protein